MKSIKNLDQCWKTLPHVSTKLKEAMVNAIVYCAQLSIYHEKLDYVCFPGDKTDPENIAPGAW